MVSLRALPLLLLGLLLSLTGCSTVESRKIVDLAPFRHVYVEHLLNDDRHLDDLIVAELKRLGYESSCGPLTMLPDNADAVLRYESRWEWDFKTYLIELKVEVHTAKTRKKLADGSYYQPNPNAKPPAEVVSRVIKPLFAKK